MNFDRLILSIKKEILQESILDAPKKNLSKEIYDTNKKLKEKYRKEIIAIFNDWKDRFIPKAKIKSMNLLGSMTTFQYTNTSDIDINIQTDLTDLNIKTFGKLLPNGNLLSGTNHPINFYLTNEDSSIKKSPALYNLLDNIWIREPKKTDTKVPKNYILEVARFFIAGVENRVTEYEIDKKEYDYIKSEIEDDDVETDKDELQEKLSQKEEEIKADLDAIYIAHKLIRAFRNEAFKEDYEPSFLIDIKMNSNPNKSINNLIYKEFERLGFFEKLKKYEDIREKMKDE